MDYKWKQTIFKPEDFDGAGQYIVREHSNKLKYPQFLDAGYLSTVTLKVCWTNSINSFSGDPLLNRYFLVDMSDGLIYTGYFITKDEKGNKLESKDWKYIEFSGENSYAAKLKICEYLNNNPHGDTFRFLTHEELVRIALYQKWRTREHG